jgi:hypothetical protein
MDSLLEGGIHRTSYEIAISMNDQIENCAGRVFILCTAASKAFSTIRRARPIGGCGVTRPSSFMKPKDNELPEAL